MYFGFAENPLVHGSKSKINFLVFLISLFSIAELGRGLARDFGLDRQPRPHHLSRRIAAAMVPIRDRKATALCTYDVMTDSDVQRVPDKIDRVLCRKDSCKCAEQGDYRCTQLYTQLNVTYLVGGVRGIDLEFELIDVEYACVCSRAVEGSDVNLLEPVLV